MRRLAVTLVFLVMATPVAAAPRTIEVADPHLEITGIPGGAVISGAGDVNGDGVPDVIVGAAGASPRGRSLAGSVYVVFGSRTPRTVDVGALGPNGFRIDGARAGDFAGSAVDGAGDMTADGRSDLVISAPRADPGGREAAGSVYVVFGRSTATTIDLRDLGTRGFRIDGPQPAQFNFGLLLSAVAGAGDVNRDGRADVVIGSPGESNFAGAAYVVFGKTTTGRVDLAALGARGFTMREAFGEQIALGFSVDGAGDLNRDGLADVAVGAPDWVAQDPPGAAWIVLGRRIPGEVALEEVGNEFFFVGPEELSGFGSALAGAGDTDGDRRPDLAVSILACGFGQPEALVVSATGARRALTRPREDICGGNRIDGAGDVDGDGRADVALTAIFTDPGADPVTRAFVVYGNGDGEADLSALGSDGFEVLTPSPPVDVAGVGDLTGDGRAEVAVAAAPAGDTSRVVVVSGPGCTITGTPRSESLSGTPGDDVICAGAGNDSVDAGAGRDIVLGEVGSDRLLGGDGDDALDGGDGGDRLEGGDGDDHLTGRSGADILSGAAGNDRLRGGDAADRATGADGDDSLEGDAGNDVLIAGSGADALEGDRGADVLKGERGDDRLLGGDGADVLAGGEDRDVIFGGAENDRASGGIGDDFLEGDTGRDQLQGDQGDDFLDGFDYLDPGDIEDIGPSEPDVLRCGIGFDTSFGDELDSLGADCELR